MTGKPESNLVHRIRHALVERYGGSIFLFKSHGGPYQMPGLPDLVCCVGGRFVGLEVKVGRNDLTLLQYTVAEQIRGAGGVAVCVRSVREALVAVQEVVVCQNWEDM